MCVCVGGATERNSFTPLSTWIFTLYVTGTVLSGENMLVTRI